MKQPIEQCGTMEPIIIKILEEADRLLYSDDVKIDEKPEDGSTSGCGLKRRSLADVVKCHLMQRADEFDTVEKRLKESARLMGILQKFLMDRMLERRGPGVSKSERPKPPGLAYIDQIIERNNMVTAFDREENCRGPPTLKQLAMAELKKTPSLIAKKMPKSVTLELIEPVLLECDFFEIMKFVKINQRFLDDTNELIKNAIFEEFKGAIKQPELQPRFANWYQRGEFLLKNRNRTSRNETAVKDKIKKAQEDGPTTSSSAPKLRINDSLNDEGVTKKKNVNGRKDLTLKKAQSASNPDYDPVSSFVPVITKNFRIAKGIKMNTKDAKTPEKSQAPLPKEHFSLSPLSLSSSDSDFNSNSDSRSKQKTNPSQKQKSVTLIENNLTSKKANNIKLTIKNAMRQEFTESDDEEDEHLDNKTPSRGETCAKCHSFHHEDDFDSVEEEEEQTKNPDQPITANAKYTSKNKSHKHREKGFQWIRCDHCLSWYHLLCSGLEQYEYYLYEKFFCEICVSIAGPSIELKKVAPHRYNWYSSGEVNKKTEVGSEVWIQNFVQMEHQLPDPNGNEVCIVHNGHEFYRKLEESGGFGKWKEVYLIKDMEGLNMRMPEKNTFDVETLVQLLGKDYEIDTIDVYNQNTYSMKLSTFVQKYRNPNPRKRLYNFLSLEFSDNAKMREYVSPPRFVETISMVDRLWPNSYSDEYAALADSGDVLSDEHRPKVQLFCLSGMANSYTDFHIDFGGSSVYYHILKGQKVFYIAEPSTQNLKAFAKHETTKNTNQWFGDKIPESIKRVVIEEGQTLLIPAGWIHAVWTPVDSLVFGGNFLHLGNAEMQMKIYQLEKEVQRVTKMDEKFFYPNFEYIHWMYLRNVILKNLREINDEGEDMRMFDATMWRAANCILKELTKWCRRDEDNGHTNELDEKHSLLRSLEIQMSRQEKIQNPKRKVWKAKNVTRNMDAIKDTAVKKKDKISVQNAPRKPTIQSLDGGEDLSLVIRKTVMERMYDTRAPCSAPKRDIEEPDQGDAKNINCGMVRPHAQYSTVEPVFMQIPRDADRSLYSEDTPEKKIEKPANGSTDKFGLKRRCLADVVKCHLMQRADEFDTVEKRLKESARLMGILQKFLMDRMLERRGPDYYEDDTDEPDCSFFIEEVIEWNKMMNAFNRKKTSRGPPTLMQLATAELKKTPSLIAKKMPKSVTLELIEPVLLECDFFEIMKFVKINQRFLDDTNELIKNAIFEEFKGAKKQPELQSKFANWYQRGEFLLKNRNKTSRNKAAKAKITKAQEDGPTTSSSAPKRRINDSLNDEGVAKKKKANGRKDLTLKKAQSASNPDYDPRASSFVPVITKNLRIAKGIKMNTKDAKTPEKSQAPLPKEHFSLSPLSLSSSDSDFNSNSDSRSKQKTNPSQKQKSVTPIENNSTSKKAKNIKLTIKNAKTPEKPRAPLPKEHFSLSPLSSSSDSDSGSSSDSDSGSDSDSDSPSKQKADLSQEQKSVKSIENNLTTKKANDIKLTIKNANIPQKQQTSPFRAEKNRSLEVSQSAPFTGIAPEASSSAPKRKNTDPIHSIRPKWIRMEENPADMFSF